MKIMQFLTMKPQSKMIRKNVKKMGSRLWLKLLGQKPKEKQTKQLRNLFFRKFFPQVKKVKSVNLR